MTFRDPDMQAVAEFCETEGPVGGSFRCFGCEEEIQRLREQLRKKESEVKRWKAKAKRQDESIIEAHERKIERLQRDRADAIALVLSLREEKNLLSLVLEKASREWNAILLVCKDQEVMGSEAGNVFLSKARKALEMLDRGKAVAP